MAVRTCAVSFKDVRGIRHVAEVQAESLCEAVVLALGVFRQDPWIEQIGSATVMNVDIREPTATHAVSLQQVERWLYGATTSPNEAVEKAKGANWRIGRAAPPLTTCNAS